MSCAERGDRDGDRAEGHGRGVGHQGHGYRADRLQPDAESITLQIATGVPNPASASSSAPKQNAITIT